MRDSPKREPLLGANVSSVPNRSPFRFPGGKTWLIPQVRRWFEARGGSKKTLVEPFAGGATVALTGVFEKRVGRALLVDRDPAVRDVWWAIFGQSGRTLAEQIASFEVTQANLESTLRTKGENLRERAFRTILRNRVNRNGILSVTAGRLKRGESGRGLSSRWYPETLANRVRGITERKDRFALPRRSGGWRPLKDGVRFMQKMRRDDSHIFFIDPPYRDVGKRLYRFSNVQPATVFECAAGLSGDFLMTYRNTDEVCTLARQHDFDVRCIKMQNGHNSTKTELLIGRDLSWTHHDPK
jgi:DNA adenine methylase